MCPVPVGAVAHGSYRPQTFRYGRGDMLLLYTDGVSEARDAHGAFYPLAEQAATWSWSGPDQLVANIEADLRAFVRGAIADDMAMAAVQREAPPARSSGDDRSRNGHAAVTWAGRG
jgi:serine phosphatase RsbU (regulator of sigma subunit)